jgi:hypothetical protein
MENDTPETETTNDLVKISLTVTLEEANLILASLQELPHKLVNNLIQNLVQQAQSQLK